MKHFYFATGNEKKFEEAAAFIQSQDAPITLERFPISIPETQTSDPDAILLQKVEYVKSQTALPFVVDDTSFYSERYPLFPGAYAKFTNEALGYEGMSRLFETGDKVTAVARLALYNFGDISVHKGEVEGRLDMSKKVSDKPFSFNDYLTVADGQPMSKALEDPSFQNHRMRAFANLCESLEAFSEESASKKIIISERWSSRASTWKNVIEDENSYVNYEANYERVNALIRKYGPLATGRALEVGCGTGEAGRILKISNPSLDVLSTDISDGMLEEARQQTADQGLTIRYKKADIIKDEVADEVGSFGMVLSRGVVISHLPKADIFDFLESLSSHTSSGGYLLFDFIQNISVGEVEVAKPVDTKNEFTIAQIDEIMGRFGFDRIDNNGDETRRVRVVCYQKRSVS
jgi:inosine/xanthosine triphosphate pyrophosphatase family protein/2-polyprenyl-3-methyl-5-hydroxy-6-metoxy-1,4-benzoquinol methylase